MVDEEGMGRGCEADISQILRQALKTRKANRREVSDVLEPFQGRQQSDVLGLTPSQYREDIRDGMA